MKKIKKKILEIFKIILITFLFFLLLDLMFGKKILKILDPYLKKTQFYDKRSRISHNIFHHTFKSNIDIKNVGFNKILRLCTNQYGFKSKCELNENNFFDYGLIGDSFTEGIGLNYEDTFVGIFEENTKYSVANLGVSSYSPKIYLAKLNYFLNKGIKFKHIIVFLDTSDYYDDAHYNLNNNLTIEHDNRDKLRIKLRNYFPFTNYYFYVIKNFRSKPLLKKNKVNETKNINKNKNIINNWLVDDSVVKKTSWLYNDIYEYTINKKKFLKIHEDVKSNLNKIYEILKKKNIKFSLAIYPWPHNLQTIKNSSFYQNEWYEFCKLRCEHFFNYFKEFEEELAHSEFLDVYNKYYFWGDVHFNKKGNILISKKLIKILSNK